MKRSSKLALISAVGVTAVLAYTWYAGNADADTESDVYTSISDCVSSGKDEATCTARFGQALETHIKTAPRFVSQQDCEKDFGAGACAAAPPAAATAGNTGTTASGGNSYFVPMMMGFMAARMMQGGQMATPAAPLYGCAQGGAAGASCYSSNSGRSYYAYAGAGNSRTVKTPVSEFRSSSSRGFSVVPRGGSAVRTAVNSRGGFGSTGRSYSSGSYGG